MGATSFIINVVAYNYESAFFLISKIKILNFISDTMNEHKMGIDHGL